MPTPGPVAGVIAQAKRRIGGKVTTGAGTTIVDRAADPLPDFAIQRNAARRRRVGAAQTDEGRRQRRGQRLGHAGLVWAGQVGAMKIDTEGSAAGAAGKTDRFRHEVQRLVKR